MNSSVHTYGGQGNVPSTVQEAGTDLIPFTGLDVWFLAVGAVLLIAAGILMSHLANN